MASNGSEESDEEYRFKCALMEEVKNDLCLYDKADPLYFNTHVTNDKFAEIAVTLMLHHVRGWNPKIRYVANKVW